MNRAQNILIKYENKKLADVWKYKCKVSTRSFYSYLFVWFVDMEVSWPIFLGWPVLLRDLTHKIGMCADEKQASPVTWVFLWKKPDLILRFYFL